MWRNYGLSGNLYIFSVSFLMVPSEDTNFSTSRFFDVCLLQLSSRNLPFASSASTFETFPLKPNVHQQFQQI
jgi:hypothetical protein